MMHVWLVADTYKHITKLVENTIHLLNITKKLINFLFQINKNSGCPTGQPEWKLIQ